VTAVPYGRGRSAKILRVLAAYRRPLSTPELVAALAENIPDNTKALTLTGNALRKHEQRGWVTRAGQAPGGYQRGPSVLWAITPAGRGQAASRGA